VRIQYEKTKATNNKRLKQLNDHLTYLRGEKDGLQEEFDLIDQKCQKIEDRASKLRFNFEVIIYLKQGQVEVP
jgi:predicted nuclease with TOPRIM domain